MEIESKYDEILNTEHNSIRGHNLKRGFINRFGIRDWNKLSKWISKVYYITLSTLTQTQRHSCDQRLLWHIYCLLPKDYAWWGSEEMTFCCSGLVILYSISGKSLCIKLRIEFRAQDTFLQWQNFCSSFCTFWKMESFSITIEHKIQQQHNTPLTFKLERWDWIQGHCNKKETSRHLDMWDSWSML